MNVLILCTGNSCRSQMAHGFLQSFDQNIRICSAGVCPAEKVHPLAVEVMSEVGIDISRHTPSPVTTYLNDTRDYVITVCGRAQETCPVFTGRVGKRVHVGFDDPAAASGTAEYVKGEFIRIRNEIQYQFTRFYTMEIKGQQLRLDEEVRSKEEENIK